MMTTYEPNVTDAQCDDAARRPYHAPELVEHGELTTLTKGVAGSGADGGGYTSFDV